MNFFNKKLIATCFIAIGLTACSSNDLDESQLVAELTEFDALFEPEVVWDKGVGSGSGGFFSRIKPIYAYDKIYSVSRTGLIVAFEPESGDVVWDVDLRDIHGNYSYFDNFVDAQINGAPVAGINKLFLGTENGRVYALDAETGELVWENIIKGEVVSAPAIDSGVLVVNSASGVLKAFNASTGEELWTVVQDVPSLTLRGVSSPAISQGGVIIGAANGDVSVFLLEEGHPSWVVPIGEPAGATELERIIDVDSSPVIYGDKVYAISTRGNLVSIDLRSGRVLWKRQYSSYRQIAISGNTIYLTDVKGHVYAIDRSQGLERWSQLSLTNREVTGPAIDGEYLVVGDYEGYLHWLSQETGEIVARHRLDKSSIHATPTSAEDMIYSQSIDGNLQAIKSPR